MSTSPDTGFDLEDLELQLLPAWARQPSDTNRFAKFEGGDGRSGPHRDRSERDGRNFQRAPGREQRGPRRPEPRDRERYSQQGGPRREERREPVQPLPEISVALVPEEKGVESLARQIKLTGRSYPIFGVAHLVLKKPDRYRVVFAVVKKPDGQIAQPLWLCNLDDTLWLSEQDAVDHVLRKHFDTFYKTEKVPTDPPKGTYTFVAQCGLSGVVLGPPNYHDYQNKLRKLHAERFARMPFETYKAKVRIVRDEEVVKKWIDEQSWKTEYNCLNLPEPKKLGSRGEVEGHFREVHFTNIIRTVERQALSGVVAQRLPTPALRNLLRRVWDEQQRFPLKLVNTLSQQFAAHGLQFFKVNKTITHVAVARPHYLDLEATPVSEGIKRIVDFINATLSCTRRKLLEALTPTPAPATTAGAVAPAEPPTAPTGMSEPTPEQTAVIADLHWLIHQGHVLEFANGKMETAKKPNPKPPKPEAKPAESKSDAAAPAEAIPNTAAAVQTGSAGVATSAENAPEQATAAETTSVPAIETSAGGATATAEPPGESAPAVTQIQNS